MPFRLPLPCCMLCAGPAQELEVEGRYHCRLAEHKSPPRGQCIQVMPARVNPLVHPLMDPDKGMNVSASPKHGPGGRGGQAIFRGIQFVPFLTGIRFLHTVSRKHNDALANVL